VLEIKEGKYGSPAKFETEPPFVVVLPSAGTGPNWERPFHITLEPPQGAGEKFDAVQQYAEQAAARKGPVWTFRVRTAVKNPPEAVADRLPLVPLQPEGTIEFDTAAGLLRKATLTVDKELKGHQGDDSSYHYTSSYSETYLPPAGR
jgi:hypothetical protein